MHKNATVLKYGGAAGDPRALCAQIRDEQQLGRDVVVVHGGGPQVDAWLERLQIQTPRVGGLRVTSPDALDVVEAVLCGLVNKALVRALAQAGINAVGVSGEDGALLRARRVPHLGQVGEIVHTDIAALRCLLRGGFVPVVAPLALSEDLLNALNVNADSAAAAIAAALRAQSLAFLSDVQYVLRDRDDQNSRVQCFTRAQAHAFAKSPACEGGMIPKFAAALAALENGVSSVSIGKTVIAG